MLIAAPPDLARHRRIVIHGVTGSGKTTLASRLATAGGLPHVAVDELMWRPGWVTLEEAAQRDVARAQSEQPEWVMDSLWTSIRPVVLPRTDLIVALDYRRRVSLARLLLRTLRRLRTREKVCGGNTESWRQVLSSDSIIAWHFRTFERRHAEIARWAATRDGPPVVRLTDPTQTEAWLRRLERGVP